MGEELRPALANRLRLVRSGSVVDARPYGHALLPLAPAFERQRDLAQKRFAHREEGENGLGGALVEYGIDVVRQRRTIGGDVNLHRNEAVHSFSR